MIAIEFTSLANYVMFKLDKLENSFSQQELSLIDEILVDYNDDKINDFSILKNFSNLKKLIVKNFEISSYNLRIIKSLSKLTTIIFDNCSFENPDYIAILEIPELSLLNCKLDNYNFIYIMTYLKSLSITSGKLSLSLLNRLTKLEYLDISYSVILDNNIELNADSITELYINGTDICDLNFVKMLPKLNKLGLSQKQIDSNLDSVNYLKNKGVIILDEGVIADEVISV